MATRTELLAAIKTRYRASGAADRRRILDEFAAVSGYHRKHAIRLLREKTLPTSITREPRRVYGAAIRDALIVLWESSDRLCSKRLKPMLPVSLPSLERHGKPVLDDGNDRSVAVGSPDRGGRWAAPAGGVEFRGSPRRSGSYLQ